MTRGDLALKLVAIAVRMRDSIGDWPLLKSDTIIFVRLEK